MVAFIMLIRSLTPSPSGGMETVYFIMANGKRTCLFEKKTL